jgi:hypothetical protein
LPTRRAVCVHGYVVDHVIALVCGGRDNPSNMQWQTVADAKQKDKWGKELRERLVSSGDEVNELPEFDTK